MPKAIEQYRRGDEFLRHAQRRGATVRNGRGSHVIVSTHRGSVPIPMHSQDLGKGLRCKLIKMFAAIGLALLPLLCWAVTL